MQNIAEQIADVESQIAEKNKAIARMEEALEAFDGEPNEWYRACSFNLRKADLERESLQRKLEKLMNNQRHLAHQEQAALFKKKQAEENHALDLKRIKQAKIARKKDSDARQLKCIEMNNRKCIELRRLIAPFVGEEQSYAMADQAEKLAWEWVEERSQEATKQTA